MEKMNNFIHFQVLLELQYFLIFLLDFRIHEIDDKLYVFLFPLQQ